ncbi:hypothetical protein [Streptomyces sp. NRRL S-87]|uniref:hypothetical protein n=1 Tax=Streptomyces sp. NRRL S-87 TaxID=1463920 RepID=UPI001F2361A5|nr:hypothetical protein [Streptomyces sp. NRRL S-87]
MTSRTQVPGAAQVSVALQTEMLFSHRSAAVVGPNRSRWNSSANEGLTRDHDLPADGGPISLYAVARRALYEELAVHRSDALDLELLGFGLDLRNNQWAAFFRAVLPDLDEAALRLRWTRGVGDKWEHDRFAFVPADPDSVLGFLADQPAESWTPCAPALFYLALVRGPYGARATIRRRASRWRRPNSGCWNGGGRSGPRGGAVGCGGRRPRAHVCGPYPVPDSRTGPPSTSSVP